MNLVKKRVELQPNNDHSYLVEKSQLESVDLWRDIIKIFDYIYSCLELNTNLENSMKRSLIDGTIRSLQRK